jgi:hypothetical protein
MLGVEQVIGQLIRNRRKAKGSLPQNIEAEAMSLLQEYCENEKSFHDLEAEDLTLLIKFFACRAITKENTVTVGLALAKRLKEKIDNDVLIAILKRLKSSYVDRNICIAFFSTFLDHLNNETILTTFRNIVNSSTSDNIPALIAIVDSRINALTNIQKNVTMTVAQADNPSNRGVKRKREQSFTADDESSSSAPPKEQKKLLGEIPHAFFNEKKHPIKPTSFDIAPPKNILEFSFLTPTQSQVHDRENSVNTVISETPPSMELNNRFKAIEVLNNEEGCLLSDCAFFDTHKSGKESSVEKFEPHVLPNVDDEDELSSLTSEFVSSPLPWRR